MMVPSGWNKFDGEVGAYDLKWQDLVDKSENIKVSSSPVKSTTTAIDALGDVQDVGKNLAAKRNAKLISAKERLTDGVLFYKFDFAISDGTHQLLQLCVCKGKLWSIDASSTVSLFDSIRHWHVKLHASYYHLQLHGYAEYKSSGGFPEQLFFVFPFQCSHIIRIKFFVWFF